MKRPFPFLWLLIFLLASLLLFAGGRIVGLDEETTYRMTVNLIERRQLTLDRQTFLLAVQTFPAFLPRVKPLEIITAWIVSGVDGQTYPLYTHAQALLQLPLYLVGRVTGGPATSLTAAAMARVAVALLNPIVVAITGWLIVVFASTWGFSRRLSLSLGLIYSWGSMALAYTHTHFSDPALALFITLGAYSAYRAKEASPARWLLVAGIALGAAVYLRERTLIIVPFFVLYVALTRRARSVWPWAMLMLPLVVAGATLGAWNWLRFGSPLTASYTDGIPGTGFNTPLFIGLFGLLFSPGKGLLIYNPIVCLGLIRLFSMRRRRAEAALYLTLILSSLVFYGSYNFWTGGWNWGPRYLLPCVPLLLLAAGDWLNAQSKPSRRSPFIILAAATFALNVPAILVDHSRYLYGFGERDPEHYLKRSTLSVEDSPLIQQWPAAFEMAALYTQPAAWQAAREVVANYLNRHQAENDPESLRNQLLWADEFFRLNVPDFWFVHLWLLGFSPVAISLVVLILLTAALAAGLQVFKELRAGS